MESGVYVWKLDGIPKYVGQGLNVKKRMVNRHRDCDALNRAIKKYGYETFEKEIICYCEPEELSDLEIYYIKKLHTHVSESGYNISWGGDASMAGRKHSEESKQKMSKNSARFMLGRHHSKESRNKMSNSRMGNKNSLGHNQSDETKKKISSSKKGIKLSPEHIKKIVLSSTGRIHTEETKNKISKSQMGNKNHMFGKKSKNATSKYFGVGIHRNLYWRTQMTINGKQIYLGLHKTEVEAARAYDKYVIENNLDRPINFPEDYGVKQ
jgi:group I intron endonuclease